MVNIVGAFGPLIYRLSGIKCIYFIESPRHGFSLWMLFAVKQNIQKTNFSLQHSIKSRFVRLVDLQVNNLSPNFLQENAWYVGLKRLGSTPGRTMLLGTIIALYM